MKKLGLKAPCLNRDFLHDFWQRARWVKGLKRWLLSASRCLDVIMRSVAGAQTRPRLCYEALLKMTVFNMPFTCCCGWHTRKHRRTQQLGFLALCNSFPSILFIHLTHYNSIEKVYTYTYYLHILYSYNAVVEYSCYFHPRGKLNNDDHNLGRLLFKYCAFNAFIL